MGFSNRHIGLIVYCLLGFSILGNSQICDTVLFSSVTEFERKQVGMAQLESNTELIHVMFDDFNYAVTFAVYDKESLKEKSVFTWTKKEDDFPQLSVFSVDYFNGKIVILYTYVDLARREKVTAISALKPNGEVSHVEELSRENWDKKKYDKSHTIFKSKNSKFLGISATYPAYKNHDTEVDLYILDESLNPVAGSSLSLPGFEKIVAPSQFEISDSGSIYFLSGSDKQKADIDGKLGLEKRVYQLYRFDYVLDKLKQYDVSIADKYISDVKMKLHNNGDLYVLGFYNNSYQKGAEGVFLMVIDKVTNKIKISGKKSLSEEIKKDFISGKRLLKNPVIDDLYLDHFFIKENGNILFLSEVFYVDKRLINNTSVANLTTSIYYNFEEILCVELDQSLNYVQHQTIYKKQKSTNHFSEYYSYAVLNPESNNPLIVYNYSESRNEKNVAEVTTYSRTDIFIQKLFSEEKFELESRSKHKIAPAINPELENSFLVLQDKRSCSIAKVIF